MKNKLFFFCCSFFLFQVDLSAQFNKRIKLYTYYQTILPGIQKQVLMDDSGNAYGTENQSKPNYLIYLEHRSSKTINPIEVWVEGKGYSLLVTKVASTPIEMTDNSIPDQPKIIIMVPTTNKTVLSISLNGLLDNPSKSVQFSEPGDQNIYVVYKKRCKKLYTIKTIIIPLPSIPMM